MLAELISRIRDWIAHHPVGPVPIESMQARGLMGWWDDCQRPAPYPTQPEWLYARLSDLKWSQGQLALALRVDPRTVRRWLAGDREIPWAAAELIRHWAMGMGTPPAP